eukprot:13871528-Alexandrium_andersonii.AAC.1
MPEADERLKAGDCGADELGALLEAGEAGGAEGRVVASPHYSEPCARAHPYPQAGPSANRKAYLTPLLTRSLTQNLITARLLTRAP